MPAVVCDIQQDILGMDFITKFKLNFEWDDFDQTELYLVDRKAQIKAPLQIVTVPTDTLRVNYLHSAGHQTPVADPEVEVETSIAGQEIHAANEAIAFQVACMKQLEPVAPTKK